MLMALLKLKLRLMKDNSSLYVIMIAMSLFLAGIFGNAFGGGYGTPLAIVDQDQGVAASDLIAGLSAKEDLRVKLMPLREAQEQVINRNVIAAVTIGQGFSDRKDALEILAIRDTLETYQLSQHIEAEIRRIDNATELVTKIEGVLSKAHVPPWDAPMLEKRVKEVFYQHWQNKKPYTVQAEVYKQQGVLAVGMAIHYLAGMTLFFVTYSLMFTVGDLLEDQRLHTLDRIRIAPVTRISLLAANLIGAMVIGGVQLTVMVLSGKYLFHVYWGSNVWLVIGIGTLYLFVMSAMSLFVVSLMKTPGQLGAISPIVLTGMGMLGGCMWPLEIIQSKPLLLLADLTPHKWALGAIEQAVLTGTVDSDIALAMTVLAGMGIVYLVLGERIMYVKSFKQH